ncbi:MAG: methyltransferase [Candidatus Diapherotrites archaeon]
MLQKSKSFFLNGFVFSCPSNVYFPSDDSYLLVSSIKDCKNLFALDVGCGSGIQTLNLLQRGAKKVLAIDVNEECLKVTLENCRKIGFDDKVIVRQSNLFSSVPEIFDLIVFNPPYVPSEKIRFVDVDGGKRGREVLDEFLTEFPLHLSKNGKCYFLQSNLNGFRETERILESFGFYWKVVSEIKLFFEKLSVYCCWRKV